MIRIICIGNRYVPGDDAGPRVYDYLSRQTLPERVELIDGGLAGLNLLRFIENSRRVIFVDSVSGFGEPGQVVRLRLPLEKQPDEPASIRYDHAAGLQYLLEALPAVLESELPEIVVLGIEGNASEESVILAGQACLQAAVRELPVSFQ